MASLLTRVALRYPWVTLLAIVVGTVFAGLGTGHLRSISPLEGYLEPDDPELRAFEALSREFGGEQLAMFALGCGDPAPCHDVFEANVLALVRQLSDLAREKPGVGEVVSLTSSGVLTAERDELRVERLPESLDDLAVARFRSLVRDDPLLNATIVSSDLRTTAVIVTFRDDLADADRNQAALMLFEEMSSAATEQGFELHGSGAAMLAAAADRYARRDLAILSPIMLGLLGILLWWIFRDATSIALALLAAGLPTVWAFGLMGWTARPVTPTASTMPILILVVGISDAVHFLVRTIDLRNTRGSLDSVLTHVADEVGPPTTLTAIASTLGFLSFLAAPVPNLREFGVFSAVGIFGAWLTTFTLVPAVLHLVDPKLHPHRLPSFALGDRVLDGLRKVAAHKASLVLLVAAILSVASVAGISRVNPENNTMKLIGGSDPFVRAEHFVRRRLRPTDSLVLFYEAPPGRSLTDPRTLAELERVEALLKTETGTPSVVSVLLVLRAAQRALGDGDGTLPTNERVASQLLLLAQAADPDALHRIVTPDFKATRLSAGYAWGGSRQTQRDVDRLRGGIASLLGPGTQWSLTGTLVLITRAGQTILESLVASFSVAFLTIFLVIFVRTRSLGLTALGMIPNLVPIAVILGFMGAAGIDLDVGTAMIASITLGVSVDDTIYFLHHYQKARRGGASVSDAITYTFAIAGRPALFAAGMLTLGFFVLGFSSFQSLAIFGLLSGVTVLLAVVCELFLLPALLSMAAMRGEGS